MNTLNRADAVNRAHKFLSQHHGFAVVGIDGRSGSGKTSLALEIQKSLAHPCDILHLDDAYQGWEGLAEGLQIARDLVTRLSHGEPASLMPYPWPGTSGIEKFFTPGPLIIEGVGATWVASTFTFNLTVWLESPKNLRKNRALARDEGNFAPYWDLWESQENQLLSEKYPKPQLYIENF